MKLSYFKQIASELEKRGRKDITPEDAITTYNTATAEMRKARKNGNDIIFYYSIAIIIVTFVDLELSKGETFDGKGSEKYEYGVGALTSEVSILEELFGSDFIGELGVIASSFEFKDAPERIIKLLHSSIKDCIVGKSIT